MENIFTSLNLIIHQANFTTVDSSWSKSYFPYPNNRLYYITDGEAELKLTERKIKLEKGYIYLLPAFMMEKAICNDLMSQYYLHFQMKSNLNINIIEYLRPKIIVKAKSHKETLQLFEIIIKNHLNNSLNSHLKVQGALQLLLAPFFTENTVIDEKIKRFNKILNYIENNLSSNISNDSLAEIMN